METLALAYVLIAVVGVIVFTTLKIDWLRKTNWSQRKVLLGHRAVDVSVEFLMIVILTIVGSPALPWAGRDVLIYG